jgi:hypothetical protein
MKKLLELINKYDDTLWETEEEEIEEEKSDWIIENWKVWKEYCWHLRFNGANTVQFPLDMFDQYALSSTYWFIKWLVENNYIEYIDERKYIVDAVKEWEEWKVYQQAFALSDHPLTDLIWLLK